MARITCISGPNLREALSVYSFLTFNTTRAWHCLVYSDGIDCSFIQAATSSRNKVAPQLVVTHWLISSDNKNAPAYKNLTRRFVFMKEKPSSLQITAHLFISPDNPRTCGSDLGTHTTARARAPWSGFQYTIMNVGKTAASFSGIQNVEKVTLIRRREKKKAGENKERKGWM